MRLPDYWWRCEQSPIPNCGASGATINLTAESANSTIGSGAIGNGANFSARSYFRTTPTLSTAKTVSTNGKFTVALFVNPRKQNSSGAAEGWLGLDQGTMGFYLYDYNNGGTHIIEANVGTGSSYYILNTTALSATQHHLIFSFDNSQTGTAKGQIYVDAVSQTISSRANSGTISNAMDFKNVYLGTWEANGGYPTMLDEVMVFNDWACRDVNEVKRIMALQMPLGR